MGVRGLTRHCRQQEARASQGVGDLRDAALAVDFVGFLFRLCEQLHREVAAEGLETGAETGARCSSRAWLLLGGCALRLEQWLERWLAQLRARNVQLLFVADPPQCFGGADHRKGRTLLDRAAQKADKVRRLAAALVEAEPEAAAGVVTIDVEPRQPSREAADDSNARALEETTQLLQQTNGCFPFAREKLRAVLKRHGVPIVTATREADEELGEMVRAGRAYAVLAEDSDFFCMKGVRYIPMSSFTVQETVESPGAQPKVTISARVFTPELVAASLGLEVDQLVDLALVCGNDLTPMLDAEFDMATDLHFPIQRTQASGVLPVKDAAQWITSHLPVLENPVLKQIETKRKGFLAALYEVYRFYGHGTAFKQKYRKAAAAPDALPAKKIKAYKQMLDRYEYPPAAIDIIECGMRGLSNKFDVLAIAGHGVTMSSFLEPIRQLTYRALNKLVVDEFEAGGTIVRQVRLKPINSLATLLEVPAKTRSSKQVDEIYQQLIFTLLYATENEKKRAKQLSGLFGKAKKGSAMKTVAYSLLLLWKQDRTCFGQSCLLGPRSIDVFLLTSFLLIQFDTTKRKNRGRRRPLPRVDDQYIDSEVFASVAAYVETLKLVHQLRIILGDKSPPNSGCPTLFSAEVFLHVCAALASSGAKTGKSSGIGQKELLAVAEQFLGEGLNRNAVWQEFCRVRAALYQMKMCSSLLSNFEETIQRSLNKDRGLEKILSTDISLSPPLETAGIDFDNTWATVDANGDSSASGIFPTATTTSFTRSTMVKAAPATLVSASVLPVTTSTNMESASVPLFAPPLPPPLPLNAFDQSDVAPMIDAIPDVKSKQSMTQQPRAVNGLMPSSVAKKARGKTKGLKTGSTPPPLAPPLPPVEPYVEPTEPPSLSGLMETLPVFAHREEILKNVSLNQLTIIQGETGCGKSTSVPQFLHDDWARNRTQRERPVNIYVTQPRRIAAIELASTVARMRKDNEFGEDGDIGKVIGYRIGQKQCVSSKTKITYVTTGYMVERLIHDADALASMTHLVLDEVHERSMDVDLLLLLLRLQLGQHPHLRLVIMSATMDAKVLIKYLGSALSTKLLKKKPLFVGSKLYPVEHVLIDGLLGHFPKLTLRIRQDLAQIAGEFEKLSNLGVSARSELATKAIAKIHEKQLGIIVDMVRLLIEYHRYEEKPQCILIFVPGINAINTLFDDLTRLTAVMGVTELAQVLVLHSGIELENQQKAFQTLGRRSTKIVLSTNIAESSVTIPDVTHVINCAVEKQIEMPNAGSTHAEVLTDTWCSRASVVQRSGRAGRVMPGTAFHLITESFRDRCMPEYTTPEILRKPLDRIILQLKGRMEHFGLPSELLDKALDAPDMAHIDGAYKLLAEYDAIDSSIETHAQLTKFGSFVCHLPLNLQLCRLLMTGCNLVEDETSQNRSSAYLLNMVILVAIMSVPDLFIMPSFYHSHSAVAYIKEMRENLKAKLELDGDLWSEPLALWRFYVKLMSEQPIGRKRHLGSKLQKVAISFRRYQTLNFLISDLCSRLISVTKDRAGEFEGLLDEKAVDMLRRLDSYASSQMIDSKLQAFAKQTIKDEKQEETVLRFLIIQNSGNQVIRGKLDPPTEFADDDLEGNDRVDLRIDKEYEKIFATLSNAQKMALFGQLAGSDKALEEFAAFAYDKRLVSLYSYQVPATEGSPLPVARSKTSKKKSKKKGKRSESPVVSTSSELVSDGLSRLSFPVSLVYYVRGEKFPVTLGMRSDDFDQEMAFRFRVADSSGSSSSWAQQKDNAKVMLGNRSLFSLPVRAVPDRSSLLAVYAERLFTGDETRMFCSKCTLLPPDNVGYFPIVVLVSAPRRANIWLHMDVEAGEILTVNVDGQMTVFPPKTAMRVDAIAHVNALRKSLSNALAGSMGAGTGVRVSNLLALADEASTVTKISKAKRRRYEWRQLVAKDPEPGEDGAVEMPFLPELVLLSG